MSRRNDTERRPPRWHRHLILVALLLVAGGIAAHRYLEKGNTLEELGPWVSEAAFSFLMGLLLGKISRRVLKLALLLVVAAFVVVQYLAYRQILDVSWPVLGDSFHITPDGNLKEIVKEKVPAAGAFLLGYLLGLVRT